MFASKSAANCNFARSRTQYLLPSTSETIHFKLNASVSGIATSSFGMPPSCAKQAVVDPRQLLPNDSNNSFSQMNPAGAGDIQNVSLLKAGYHIGINTVGQSLRNANLQLRSEPANPQLNIGPWNQSSIGPDLSRRALEVGCHSGQ